MKILTHWLQTNPLLKRALLLIGGTGLAQAVGVAAIPILSRLYTPEDFAALQLFLAFASITLPLLTLRYEIAVPSPKQALDAAQLLVVGLLAALFLAPLATWTLAVLMERNWFGFASLPQWTPLIMLIYLWTGVLFFALRFWLIRLGDFGLLGRVAAERGLVRALAQVALGWWPAAALGILLGELAGQVAGLRQILWRSYQQLKGFSRHMSWPDLARQMQLYKHFPLLGIPSTLLDNVAQALPLLLISQLYGPVVAGYFAFVQRAFAVPINLLGQSIADSFHNALSELYRNTPNQIEALFIKTTRTLVFIAIGTVGLLLPFILWGFSVVFGERWQPAEVMALWMTPWLLSQLIVGPLSRVVFVLDGQRIKLIYDSCIFAAILFAYYFAVQSGLGQLDFLKLLVLLNVVAYTLYYMLLLHLVRSKARLSR